MAAVDASERQRLRIFRWLAVHPKDDDTKIEVIDSAECAAFGVKLLVFTVSARCASKFLLSHPLRGTSLQNVSR